MKLNQQKKPTRREIEEIKQVMFTMDQRIRGLEYILSEYFKFRHIEKKFEEYLTRNDNEQKANVKKSDAKVDGKHIQGGATNS